MAHRKFENAILLVLSAVILGGLVATMTQYYRAHPEAWDRLMEQQRQAELVMP